MVPLATGRRVPRGLVSRPLIGPYRRPDDSLRPTDQSAAAFYPATADRANAREGHLLGTQAEFILIYGERIH